ncbi:MAG: hypothetical protein HKN75_01760 [Bacteroidia bacterium]|nr:hypothetical protein [Bacteroidia bacterium]
MLLFLPFEIIVLKYLPVNDVLYSLSRMASEFIIYSLLLYVIATKLNSRTPFSKSPIHTPLLLFIFYSLSLILINAAPVVDSLINMRAILRYLALFYVIINIDIEYRTVVKLTKALIGIGLLQSFIAIYHHFFGINDFWMPRENVLEIAGKVSNFKILGKGSIRSGREIGVGIGTMGDSLTLSMFLVVCSALIIPFLYKTFNTNIKSRFYIALSLAIILLAILYTYSRGSFLITLLMFPISWLLVNRIKKSALLISVTILIVIPAFLFVDEIGSDSDEAYINPVMEYVSPIENVTSIFTKSYQERTFEYSRGFMISAIGGELFRSLTLIGYGPAMNFALEKAIEQNLTFVDYKNINVINDVYWIAFIIYYGIIGLALFLFILYKLLKVSLYVIRYSDLLYHRTLALSFILILVTAIPYTFIIRTFVFRQYSLYFWALAALTALEWYRLQQKSKKELAVKTLIK